MEAITTNALKHPTDVARFAANDNHRPDPRLTPSPFPKGARAVIFRPARSAMTSGKARSRGWRLMFERRSAPYVEPLMGWTADDDPLTQVELSFPTLRSAIRYAERQGLPYIVQASRPDGADRPEVGSPRLTRAFSDATLERLGLGELQGSYVDAVAGAEARQDPRGEEGWTSPMAVANDAALSIEAKRAILIDWAWTEYLIDQAIKEGMPENGRPSRLHDVELALVALERANAAAKIGTDMPAETAAPANSAAPGPGRAA